TGSSGGPRRTAPGPARSTRPPASGARALGPARQRRASPSHSLRSSSLAVLVEPPAECLVPGRAGVMAPLAERAQVLTSIVPTVAVDVVDDLGRRHSPFLSTEPAERLLLQHARPDSPPDRAVPALRRRASRRVLSASVLGEVRRAVAPGSRDDGGAAGP